MLEWWSYRLSDFLLFAPRVYWRMFERHNEAVWPLQLAMLAAGIAAFVLAVLRPRFHGRLIATLLALAWGFVAWSFLWQHYATINWAAAYVAPIFGLQALLLLVLGGFLDRLTLGWRDARLAGLLLTAFALAGYPLLAPLFGRPWAAAEIFGIAPDPTAIGTLGLLLLARGRAAILLLPVPLIWCLVSATTLWAMEAREAWIPAAAGVLAVAAGWRRSTLAKAPPG
jgi:Family of unknown function (DUF6064)